MQLKPMKKWSKMQIDFWQRIRRFIIEHKIQKPADYSKRRYRLNLVFEAVTHRIDSEEYDYYLNHYGMKRCDCCDGFGFKEK